MEDKSIFVLGVALLTWGGVLFYLLRLSALAARLERELGHREQERDSGKAEVVEAEVRVLPPR